jgi:hypothetical protein
MALPIPSGQRQEQAVSGPSTEAVQRNAPSSKSNPNQVGGEAGEYAGFAAPARADASTVAGAPGAYYNPNGEAGNTVDQSTIPQTQNVASKDKTTAMPAGPQSSSGFIDLPGA